MKLLPFIVPLVLILGFVASFFLKKHIKQNSIYRPFAAGISIAYVFIFLLPEVVKINHENVVQPLLASLFGFTIFHLAIKYVYLNTDKKKEKVVFDKIHVFASSIYIAVISLSLVELIKFEPRQTIILVFLISFHLFLSEFADLDIMQTKIKNLKPYISVFSIILGSSLGLFFHLSNTAIDYVFAIAAGSIIYVSTREEIPYGTEGKPLFFLLGTIVVTIIRFII